jgi:hypothetical protein
MIATLPDLREVAPVAGYPSGQKGFLKNVVQVFADNFVKVLSPNGWPARPTFCSLFAELAP